MDTPKSYYYQNLLSVVINVLFFSCGGTANLAKLPQGRQLFPVVWGQKSSLYPLIIVQIT